MIPGLCLLVAECLNHLGPIVVITSDDLPGWRGPPLMLLEAFGVLAI